MKTRPILRALGLAAVASASLALAAPAGAATLNADYGKGKLKYKAADGEQNALVVTAVGGFYSFVDAGVTSFSASVFGYSGGGCSLVNHGFSCPVAGISKLSVDLGDGHDSVDATALAAGIEVDGDGGGKTIATGGGSDEIDVQNGQPDTVSCGPGDDEVLADPIDTVAADCEHVTLAVVTPPTANPTGQPPAQDGTSPGTASGDLRGPIAPPAITLPASSLALTSPTRAIVPLSCSADALDGCNGDIGIFVSTRKAASTRRQGRVIAARGHYVAQQRRIGRKRFRLARGASAKVPVRISLRGHYAQLSKRRRTRALLRVTQRDAAGKAISVETRSVTLQASGNWSHKSGR